MWISDGVSALARFRWNGFFVCSVDYVVCLWRVSEVSIIRSSQMSISMTVKDTRPGIFKEIQLGGFYWFIVQAQALYESFLCLVLLRTVENVDECACLYQYSIPTK